MFIVIYFHIRCKHSHIIFLHFLIPLKEAKVSESADNYFKYIV